jgi:hypothetical protein
MNIDWSELPKHAVCIVSHKDYSGLDLCFIDSNKGLCEFDGSETVDLSCSQLVAINPSVSLKEFGRAMFVSKNEHIRDLEKRIERLEKEAKK